MLTQAEANQLIEEFKRLIGPEMIPFPQGGQHTALEAVSRTGRNSFLIDINRIGRANPNKYTLQERYRKEHILVRLDINGAPHTNPDGQELSCPHLHIYKEGYNTSWAYPVPEGFSDSDELVQWLFEFLEYCHIDIGDSSVEGVIE